MTKPKVANVGAALEQQAKKTAAIGKTIAVRAIRKGFYGRPLATIRDEGDVFPFAVKDLEPFVKQPKDAPQREAVTVDGEKYLLPSWVEDASKPAAVETSDDDELTGDAGGDDVI